jgi:hypothetical protein
MSLSRRRAAAFLSAAGPQRIAPRRQKQNHAPCRQRRKLALCRQRRIQGGPYIGIHECRRAAMSLSRRRAAAFLSAAGPQRIAPRRQRQNHAPCRQRRKLALWRQRQNPRTQCARRIFKCRGAVTSLSRRRAAAGRTLSAKTKAHAPSAAHSMCANRLPRHATHAIVPHH